MGARPPILRGVLVLSPLIIVVVAHQGAAHRREDIDEMEPLLLKSSSPEDTGLNVA